MAELIASITPFIQTYGFVGVFFVAFIEEVVAPITSLLSLMAAGFFLLPATGSFMTIILGGLLRVALPAALGLSAGAFFVYSVLYFGGEPFIRRWGRWFGISWESVQRMEERLTKNHTDEWLVFALRVIPFVPNVAVSAGCGIIRYPLYKFFLLTFIGGGLRAFLMGILGWSLGTAYTEYATEFTQIAKIAGIVFAFLLLVGIGLLIQRKIYKKRP